MSHMKPSKSKIAIRDVAHDLLCRTPGASLSQIAPHAKVWCETLHRHFASRNVLVNDLALRARDDLGSDFASFEIE
ncbi:MAG: hypothetical protein AAF754_08965 [Pseudomonadota bacterium]